MKYPDGLAITLAEESMLENSGILKSPVGSTNPFGLSDSSVSLFLAIALGGETGVAVAKLPKDLRENLSEALLPLDMKNLVEWARDRHGKQTILVLTWKGSEALDAAKTKPTNHASWGTRRKAAVNPGSDVTDNSATVLPSGPSRRRAGFAEDEIAVSSPVAVRRQVQAGSAEEASSSFDDLFVQDVSFEGLQDALSRPLRRRLATEDDPLLGTLKCEKSEDPAVTEAVNGAQPEVTEDEFSRFYDEMS